MNELDLRGDDVTAYKNVWDKVTLENMWDWNDNSINVWQAAGYWINCYRKVHGTTKGIYNDFLEVAHRRYGSSFDEMFEKKNSGNVRRMFVFWNDKPAWFFEECENNKDLNDLSEFVENWNKETTN